MDDGLVIAPGLTVPPRELQWRFSRGSGPGGQSVNTADSRVELSFDLANTGALPPHLKARALRRLAPRLVNGMVTVVAAEHRQQLQNRRAAAARLATLLAEATAPPPRPRRPTRPSRGSVERRLAGKRRQAQRKQDRRQPPIKE